MKFYRVDFLRPDNCMRSKWFAGIAEAEKEYAARRDEYFSFLNLPKPVDSLSTDEWRGGYFQVVEVSIDDRMSKHDLALNCLILADHFDNTTRPPRHAKPSCRHHPFEFVHIHSISTDAFTPEFVDF